MLKNFSKALVSVITVLLLSGCIEVDYNATFNVDEETVNGTYRVLIEKSFMQITEGDENYDSDSFYSELSGEDILKDKLEVEEISTDTHEGFVSTFTELEYADFITLFGEGAENDTSITVVEPGVVKFESNFSTFKTEEGHNIIGGPSPKAEVTLNFPGGIIEHKGGVVNEDNTSITINLLEENPDGFFVTGNVNVDSDKNVASIIAFAIIILTIAILLIVFAKRKETTDTPQEENKEEETTL